MKKIITLGFVIFISVNLHAQKSQQENKISLSAGSSTLGMVTNYWIKSSLVKQSFAPVIPQISYTFQVDKNAGIGAAFSYQYFHFDFLPLNQNSVALTANISRFNLSAHAIYTKDLNTKQNIFGGLRLGLTYWYGNISMSQLNNYLSNLSSNIFIKTLTSQIIQKLGFSDILLSKTFISYQIFIGSEYFFTQNIGVHFEFALGSPYWALCGLSYRF